MSIGPQLQLKEMDDVKRVLLLPLALVLIGLRGISAGAAGEEQAAQPVNLGEVNTKADETDPFLMSNGVTLLYASNAAGTFDLLAAQRQGKELQWGAGQPLGPLNTRDADERSPSFYAPEKTFYFASNRVPDEKFKDLKNFDIFYRIGSREAMQLPQVSTREDEMFPWVTPRGRECYFSRKTESGWRICAARGPAFGAITAGEPIKSFPAGFTHPTLTPDGLTMYLQGPVADGRQGIFRSTRARADAAWTAPKAVLNLSSKEGKQGDMAPSLSPTGNTLLFASDRPGGQGGLDLWLVKTAELKVE